MSPIRILIGCLLALGLGAESAAGQEPSYFLTGTVADSAGQPLANVLVAVVGARLVVRTDSRGRFRFDSLPHGPVSLRAEFIGFIPAQVDSLRPRRDSTPAIGIRLVPQTFVDCGTIIRPAKPSP